MINSFNTKSSLVVNGKNFQIYRIGQLEQTKQLPFSLKILLENLLRFEDGVTVTTADIQALLNWNPKSKPNKEIAFRPARVLMQDFTGVPAIVDLAAMRDAMRQLGGNPSKINPVQPTELVVDHSVQVDQFGNEHAFQLNADIEYRRNQERYSFLKWGQSAFDNFKVVPPDTGIVHQVNLEYLARVVFTREQDGIVQAYPDTLVGTDSHTTMINGLGVLGWGVGGIEAEAATLAQPVSMLIPEVVGFNLTGSLPEGTTATDLVLTIVQILRQQGVVGKFVEFYGDGMTHLPLADRATISNMAPEYGATCGIFPIDQETLKYLKFTNRSLEQIALIEAYARAQGMFQDQQSEPAKYSETLALDLGDVQPSIAGPKRPQDRVPLRESKPMFLESLAKLKGTSNSLLDGSKESNTLGDGSVVIAAITSCTNTSNPNVMIGAGLLAQKAVERGLKPQPWVKTSLAPGSRVVTKYLEDAGLIQPLADLGFHLVGYGCTTCIGNSGPLPEAISQNIRENNLTVCSVLSGNRNFEGRVHAEVRMNYLASPPLVVAYALAGRMDIDMYNEPLGIDANGVSVHLKEIWPSAREISDCVQQYLNAQQFETSYHDIFNGESHWNQLPFPQGELFQWDEHSTYVKNPPYFENISMTPEEPSDIKGARVLALLGHSVTTDHISPAGAIKSDSPAGIYLNNQGVKESEFNSYGSRRGNHEIMMRGTFANIRLRNQLAPDTEGGITVYLPNNEQMSIYDAAMKYKESDTQLLIIAGKEYGSGSSRDWAAKGPRLLGVRAVIAESYERIHRTNLVCMGILPLQFKEGENTQSLKISGIETFNIEGIGSDHKRQVTVKATTTNRGTITFDAIVRIDTPQEFEYYRNGGILQYVLRKLAQ